MDSRNEKGGKLKVIFAVLAPFVVLWATYGKQFTDALASVPSLAKAWSSQLPFGVGSVMFGLIVSMAAWAFCIHWLPDTKDRQRPQFAAASIAIAVAVMVTVGQQWGGSPGAILNAVWLGFTAGVAAPWLANGLRSLWVSMTH